MSKQIDDGGYAFGSGDMTHGGHPGMKLRDWFAGRAPEIEHSFAQQFVFDEKEPDTDFGDTTGVHQSWEARRALALRAAWSYAYADAMLAARKESPNDQP